MNTLRRCTALAALAAFSALSQASLLTYQFTIALNAGPQTGSSVSGTFAFDSSIAPVGGGDVVSDAITDFAFSYGGISYDESTVESALLRFNASGALTSFVIGTDCHPGQCIIGFTGGDWVLIGPDISPSISNRWVYEAAPGAVAGGGTVSFALQQPGTVPEPGSLALGGLALSMLVASSRRRRA